MEMTFRLIVGKREWLYEGRRAIARAKFAARLLLRRKDAIEGNVKLAYIVPHCAVGDTIIINKKGA